MSTIFILGSINMDMIVETQRFPELGETITGQSFSTANGGKGANQAVACSRLGSTVKMCGCVGNDSFGMSLVESLKNNGVDTRHILVKETSTGVAVITLVNGDNTIIVSKGANSSVSKEQIDPFFEEAHQGDIFLTQLETDFECVKYALKKAKEKGLITVLNPAPASDISIELCKYCDYIIPNETELYLMTQCADAEKALKMLIDYGCNNPIVTLGSKGCAYIQNGVMVFKPCEKAIAIDTTGAGDTFCGAFCSRIADCVDFETAVEFSLKAATISVTRKGAQPSVPYLSEIQ